jgi:ABC-2 type transport system permease protein/fluoroquinolone transport system permease protein
VVLGLGLLLSLSLRFALPDHLSEPPTAHVHAESAMRGIAQQLTEDGQAEHHPSEQAARAAVRADRHAYGVLLEGTPKDPRPRLILQGFEPTWQVNGYEQRVRVALLRAQGRIPASDPQPTRLGPPTAAPLSLPQRLVPVLIVMDVVLIGFLIAGVLLLQEKQQGTVAAYRVSPAGVWVYILPKLVVNGGLAGAYCLVLLAINPPTTSAYLPLAGLCIALACAAVSFAGIAMAVFFRGLQAFFFPAAIVLWVLNLPIIGYFHPGWRPPWVMLLPTDALLIALREALYPVGREELLHTSTGILAVLAGLAGIAAWLAVEHRLIRVRG